MRPAGSGAEPLRLYLVKEIAFGSDGDFTWDRFEDLYNADLANNLGNLVSRVAAMAEKYRGGRLLPAGSPGRLAGVARQSVEDYRRDMDAFALEGGTAAAFRIVDAANEYIAETEPWALARDASNADRLSQVLFDVAEAVRIAAILLLPIMPRSSAEILRRVGAGTGAPLLDGAAWRNEGERVVVKGDALWPRSDDKAGLRTGEDRSDDRRYMTRPARRPAIRTGAETWTRRRTQARSRRPRPRRSAPAAVHPASAPAAPRPRPTARSRSTIS